MKKEITFECEIVTPMFLAGADGRTPELRVPSIKGAMRFWWRAMNGHMRIKDLREEEAKIFGGRGENEGRSKFSIRIEPSIIKSINIKKYQPLPHHDNDIFCKENNCEKNKQDNCKKSFKLPALNPTFKFKVKFKLQETKYFSEEQLKNLFILTSLLGDLGKRARRGFGSFTINKVDNSKFIWNINPDYIVKLLKPINIDGTHFKNNQDKIESDFNLKHFPYIKEIKIGEGNSDYNELLKKIGKASHDYNCDHIGYTRKQKRFASPVYVSVIKKNNKYFPMVTILETVVPDLSGTDKSQNFIREVLS